MDLLFGQHAGWFAAPAIIGTAFFLLRLLFLMTGLGHAHDMNFDVGGDIHTDPIHPDPAQAFKALSIQTIATFLMGFGWAGLGGYRGMGMDMLPSLGVGVLGGAAMVWLLGLLLKAIYDLQSSGNITIDGTIGHEGDVYVTVPANGKGRGQVRVTISNRQRIYNAVSSGDEIKPSSRVRVTNINQDHTLTVTPV